MKEALAVSQKEKDLATNNFNNQITRLKEDFERKMKQSELSTNDSEERQKEAERRNITIRAQLTKKRHY